jgi:hypothetical protein
MAKSPLMYGGDLRAMDNATLSLITNPGILDINAHSVDNHEVILSDSEGISLQGFFVCQSQAPHLQSVLYNKSEYRSFCFAAAEYVFFQHKLNVYEVWIKWLQRENSATMVTKAWTPPSGCRSSLLDWQWKDMAQGWGIAP